MAFDSPTRKRLQRMVDACRYLLTVEFEEQLQERFGIYPAEGRVLAIEKLSQRDDQTLAIAQLLRRRVEHLSAQGRAADSKEHFADAVQRVLREQAFSVLNRFAALRMAEERGFIPETVGGGFSSKGALVFADLSGTGLGSSYDRYRVFLDRVFDELSLDLGVLFDRFSPYALLFPREIALRALFDELNSAEIRPLWKEDETIGWIYQYYNDEAERKKMREESATPRNSRELAVRNQFFTPRYVVEFLTDNTLGRLWYEMTCGKTALRDCCRYLVRRPTEIFLKAGECPPYNEASTGESLSQEELLRQPIYISRRPLKDPRDIRLLDPACGSMHFGLYAFDLFIVIYDEAWEIAYGSDATAKSAETFAPFVAFAATFSNKAAFLREVPRLIIEHNIHGIEIDPRAAQIAGLSLWLRAQRAWHEAGVRPADRPCITRSNLVCAEPMPGEKELLREFVEQQFPIGERPTFAFLLETIFDRMKLAGEAGSLLRIEEEIRTTIADAKQLWKEGPRNEQTTLFVEPGKKASQAEIRLDLSGIGDEEFWERAEQRIYDALETYADQAENGGGFRRRLFADDAAQGIAFIDLCRKRYNVVVMNPPFGAASSAVDSLLAKNYGRSRAELYAAFIERGAHLNTSDGFIGAITSRTGLYLPTYSEWRTEVLLNEIKPTVVADLGSGVLDAAMVETAAYCLNKNSHRESFFFNLVVHTDKATLLAHSILKLASSSPLSNTFLVELGDLLRLPSATFAYWIPQEIRRLFNKLPRFDKQAITRRGMATLDDFRFVRLVWEIPLYQHGETSGWVNYSKGESSTRFYECIVNTVNWFQDGREVKSYVESKVGSASRTIQSESKYFSPGLTWVRRTQALSVRVLPVNVIFSGGAQGIFVGQSGVNMLTVLGLVSSSLFDGLTKIGVGRTGDAVQFEPGMLARVPTPSLENGGTDVQTLCDKAKNGWKLQRDLDCFSETSPWFSGLSFLFQKPSSIADLYKQRRKVVEEVYCRLASVQADIDKAATRLYGFEVENESRIKKSLHLIDEETAGQQSDDLAPNPKTGLIEFVASVQSLAVGFVYGRFDICGSIDGRQSPEVTDPFGPLPVCPPGMLQGDDGLPLSPEAGRRLQAEGHYPLDVAWTGILVDDAENPLDIERCLHGAFMALWGERGDSVEHEVCALLGVPTLREWYRRPAGFFADHLKRYSKSRRQAPIYWPISTVSGRYTLWIYYHRLTEQTLFQSVNEFVKPKISEVEADLTRLRANAGARPDIDALSGFLAELVDFRDELLRITALPYKPNLNDGVLITACPLWKLFRLPKWQKDLKACWDKLARGEYDWAHIAYSIWPERVRGACRNDRSLAIAHGLEELFNAPESKAGRKKKKRNGASSEAQGTARSSSSAEIDITEFKDLSA